MRKIYKEGKHYGMVKILSIARYKPRYYILECQRCGKQFTVSSSEVIKNANGCSECRAKDHEENLRKEYDEKYSGKTYGNLKILNYTGERNSQNAILALCECQLCGRITKIPYTKITSGQSKKCRFCNAAQLYAGREIGTALSKGGSRVLNLKRSKPNKNGSTGHIGVSRRKNGKYRAYISLKRKQYHLGLYQTLEEAIAARKEAEEKYHEEFIEWYKETYPEAWNKYMKKEKK